jgi:multimeric flavodoxin WrbA
MKIVGILGSSRRGGNTEYLLDLALEEAQKHGALASKIAVEEKKIAPCNGCLGCVQTGECVIQDDMQEVYGKMLESEGILWATPVYFWSMTGQAKTVLDRTYALGFPKLQLASKVGGMILVAGNRGCMNTANLFHMYFNYNHMFFAEFAWGYGSEKGEIRKNNFAMQSVREMVQQMVSLIRAQLKFPEEFDVPLRRRVKAKYGV